MTNLRVVDASVLPIMVSGNLKPSRTELTRAYGAERAGALLAEASQCLTFLEELLAREGIECHYRRTGRFIGAHYPGAYASLAH